MNFIPSPYLRKWQKTVDLLALLIADHDARMSRLEPDGRMVVMLSAGAGRGPQPGQVLPADFFCHRVIRDREMLSVAVTSPGPAEGPRGSYLGVPLLWPDRSVYGTLCVCADGPCVQEVAWQPLVQQLRQLIESDLRTLHYVRAVDVQKEQLEGRLHARHVELEALNERLAQELEQTHRFSEALRQLTTSGDAAYGESFFRNLVQQLVRLFGGNHAYVAVFDQAAGPHATTLAICSDGQRAPNFSYKLGGMPCQALLTQPSLVIPQRLQQFYPNATWPGPLQAQSYVGVQLCGAQGLPIGVLVVLGRAELPDSQLARQLMELTATRTSTEIQRMRAEGHLRRLIHEDDLTGLANRTRLQAHLREAIVRAQRDNGVLAVLFIDLDNFKTVNDSLGHDVGDALLIEVARRLRCCFRDTDVVARLGGDEFAVVLEGQDVEALDLMGEQIIQRFTQPCDCGDHELFVSVSIGISQYPGDGIDANSLLRTADAAMYQAKELGKNQFQYASQALKQKLQRDQHLGTRLRKALMARQFDVHYQPKLDIASRTITGAEALIAETDAEMGTGAQADVIQ